MPKFNEWLFGSKDKIKQGKLLNKQQEQLMSLIQEGLTKGEGPFAELFGGFDESGFNEGVIQPAIKNFKEQVLPQLQEQFIANNQILGSGFLRAQNKAGNDLQSKLAELKYGAQQKQKENQFGGLNLQQGTKAFENFYKQGSEGALSGFVKGVGQGLGQAAGGAAAGGGAPAAAPVAG